MTGINRHPTTDVHRLAVFYKKAIEDEFPQYWCLLDLIDLSNRNGDWAFLRVYRNHDNKDILTVEFLSSRVKIVSPGHNDIVNYADPRFTEDILSKVLSIISSRAYLHVMDENSYIFGETNDIP